ncbi:Ppx/GppA phosphatase family protein [Tistrella bauzanensis]|uniref:Ppx/GppA phosphatase family protein n=1 Tax=Tistrella arctica TaxID=3133430 RepID=A0ABU9YEE0_9PROT
MTAADQSRPSSALPGAGAPVDPDSAAAVPAAVARPHASVPARPAAAIPAPVTSPVPPVAQVPVPHHNPSPPFAALDLGTNNCRLLIARPSGDDFVVLDSFSRITRLGEGVEASGMLLDTAIDRTVRALKVCGAKLRRWPLAGVRLVATEACRRAGNADVFRARVASEAGLELEIIPADEEARLAVIGCAPLIDRQARRVIVVDIGGGSTELTVIEPDDSLADGLRRIDWVSLPLGVVTMADRFGGGDVPPATYRAMRAEVSGRLVDLAARVAVDDHIAAGAVQLVGTSGTLTTLAGVHFDLASYDRGRVDGRQVTVAGIRETAERLRAMDLADRGRHPCVGRSRADLVVPGAAIMEGVCDAFPVTGLTVADRGLREGMLYEMIAAHRSSRRRPDRRGGGGRRT